MSALVMFILLSICLIVSVFGIVFLSSLTNISITESKLNELNKESI